MHNLFLEINSIPIIFAHVKYFARSCCQNIIEFGTPLSWAKMKNVIAFEKHE